jgi:hypothetical protein
MALTNANVSVLRAVEEFLKIEYVDGLTNEFNTMDSLINSLKKDKIMGEKIEKTFALGVSDNVRTMGLGNDTYQLGLGDFGSGAETVTAEFKAMAKLIGVFAVTDETIVKGTTSGSIVDVVSDNLNRMKLNLKNTYQRMVYGSSTGKIGVTTGSGTAGILAVGDVSTVGGKQIIKLRISNSHSILPGTGLLFRNVAGSPAVTTWIEGKVWQKDNSVLHDEVLQVIVERHGVGSTVSGSAFAVGTTYNLVFEVFTRQLQYAGGAAGAEYTGLEDIVIDTDSEVFGIDRAVYTSLKTTIVDLEDPDNAGEFIPLNETILRDLSDHIMLTANDDARINIVASQPRIISALEKQLYQFKRYNIDAGLPASTLGTPKIMFDQWAMQKDKFARDRNVYLLDATKVGELLRKDFGWLTSGGPQGILERRTGTEVYEGIMTKYGDMMVDSFRAHAAFVNAGYELEA